MQHRAAVGGESSPLCHTCDESGWHGRLWGTTFAGVAYGPVGMLLSLMSIAYTAMIVHDIKDAPGAAVLASGMCSVCLLVCAFSVSAVLIGTLAEGLWNEDCIDHDSNLGKYATGIFWASVSCMGVGLVGSVFIWTVALVRKSCGGSSGNGSHMSMV